MGRPFLTARWSNVFILTYVVPPALLQNRLPPGLELDTRGTDAFVSLVAFDFQDTRVLGLSCPPGYRNFPELNLRFYVRHGPDRGVVFVREIVPQHLVSWLARVLYNEPYVAAPVSTRVLDTREEIATERRLTWGRNTYAIAVSGATPAFVPAETSDEHFFKEHHWGYGVSRRGRTIRYRVEHPVWEVYPIQSYRLDFDWGQVYGQEWNFLDTASPCSKVFAVGSGISVFPAASISPWLANMF
jgi:uncharacterized protein YqjF (DUF2071 family)